MMPVTHFIVGDLTKVTLSTADTVPNLQVFIRLIIKEKIKTILLKSVI